MKTKRTVFHVVYDRDSKRWVAKVGGMIVRFCYLKTDLIGIGPDTGEPQFGLLSLCDRMWRACRIPSQIIIHTRDGKIAKEYTYGNDPKRARG